MLPQRERKAEIAAADGMEFASDQTTWRGLVSRGKILTLTYSNCSPLETIEYNRYNLLLFFV